MRQPSHENRIGIQILSTEKKSIGQQFVIKNSLRFILVIWHPVTNTLFSYKLNNIVLITEDNFVF